MTLHNIFGLLCSIGMFLFGIDIMSEGLRSACGTKMKNLLSLCTKNRFLGVLTGFAVTTAIQSSSATTVMAVSFIDSGLMTLAQSVGIIMGANIGTTVTSLLIAVNFSSIAPIAVFIGTAIKMFAKKEKTKSVGIVLVGFGLLFVAISSMDSFMSFFKDNGTADSLMTACSGKFKSIIIGFVITAIMQSSSATVGILQSVAGSGLISCEAAVYILFGQNIGAVIPTLLSSVNANKEAKKAAVVHLLFNVFGTAIFILISLLFPYIDILEKISDGSLMVSLAHIIFNVVSTVILFPAGNILAKTADKIVTNRLRIVS
ncbi:MAG: Na/Pi symporter [Faecalibacterium sp.]|nr:Na/Pi symporter [Ruminococcus sp.]MCM1391943.1 Na/Pi symporter [Ruminococcus sp.]MCM1484971.1 Na/Pi symporter [Faecalibacterium sp.]